MILSNTAIFEALDDGRLVISPEPVPRLTSPGGPKSAFSPSSVDLTLGSTLSVAQSDHGLVVDLRQGGNVPKTLAMLTQREQIDPTHGYQIKRGDFLLAQTAEVVSLPLRDELTNLADDKPTLAARVEGKSSLARYGLLVHFTAPTIQAGWTGPITLEMTSLGHAPIVLYPGMPICQLIIEEVHGEATDNPSQFEGQVTPEGLR